MPNIPYRLALDLGTGSIGWAVLDLSDNLQPNGIRLAGSRIFSTGRLAKDNTTLAAERRGARSARRRRDRQLQRSKNTVSSLIRYGLFPSDKHEREALKNLNPWFLRYNALREELSPFEIGRALFHLQQRRGFKSNRKVDRGDSDTGAMKMAIQEFKQNIPEEETVGSYLWLQILAGNGARARHTKVGAKIEYDFYVDRSMVEEEFNRIWFTQREFHPGLLTDTAYENIYKAIFAQRDLKPVEAGKCFLDRSEFRAHKALPSTHLFRVLQEVNNLRVIDPSDPFDNKRALSREERDRALDALSVTREMVFTSLAKKVFGKTSPLKFNLEAGQRSKIKGNQVGAQMLNKKAFGEIWSTIPLSEQDFIVESVLNLEDEAEAVDLAVDLSTRYSLDIEQATHIVNDIKLDDGYGRVSSKAIFNMLPYLQDGWDDEKNQALTYDKAADLAGYSFNVSFGTGAIFDELPYYGEILHQYTADVPRRDIYDVLNNTNSDELQWGRIANPTVHIGLNEIRKIVNALIKKFGKPEQIHVEVARELSQSKERRDEINKIRNENEKLNERLNKELDNFGLKKNRANRERLKLFEELAQNLHRCVFCGTSIEKSRLFTNSYQVDHILPFSRTLDDSLANKVLVCARCNQEKGNQSPFEKWGSDSNRWPEIFDRAATFKSNKARRFEPEAMQKVEEEGGFLARQLTDTAYLSRVARQYLGCLYADPAEIQRRIIVSPGRLTALLRAKWGLNDILSNDGTKNRDDHRHHAVDAIVIGVSDRSILKKVSDANRQAREQGLDRLLENMPLPWSRFREDAISAIQNVNVSHKPDHGIGGQLHEDTAYGIIAGPNAKGEYLTRKRKDNQTIEEKWRRIIPIFRQGDDPETALPYKGYIGGSNQCIEIHVNDKGRWVGEVISKFQSNQNDYRDFMTDRKNYLKTTFSGKPLVMRLHRGDSVLMEIDGQPTLMRLVKINSDGKLSFQGLMNAKTDPENHLRKNSGPLRDLHARRVFIDPIGQVKDPGWQE